MLSINQTISAKILINVANGMELPAAMDAVLGQGTHAKLVSDLYEELRG